MSATTHTPDSVKRRALLEMLDEDTSVKFRFDPRKAGIGVPPQYRKQTDMCLEVGHNMAIPIHDLRVEFSSVIATLSFGGRPYLCGVPLAAIFAANTEKTEYVWADAIPKELTEAGKRRQKPLPQLVSSGDKTSSVGAAAGKQKRVLPVGWRVVK